ncbi:MAG: c-type cytochrome [Candidatus Binataceae bacterium]
MRNNLKNFVILASLIIPIVAGARALAAAPDLAAAKDNYNMFCSKCHGANGKGDGPAAASLHTQPRNYTDCAKMSKIPDDTLFKAIKDGGASVGLSGEMPSWSKGLDDDEIHGLVAYVRSFCKQ